MDWVIDDSHVDIDASMESVGTILAITRFI